jgi:hypothetical protein
VNVAFALGARVSVESGPTKKPVVDAGWTSVTEAAPVLVTITVCATGGT